MDVFFQGAEDGVEEECEVRAGSLSGDGRDPGVLRRGDIGFGDQQGALEATFLEQEDVVADRIFVDGREVRVKDGCVTATVPTKFPRAQERASDLV